MFSQEGNYTCTATNKYGSVKVHFRVIFIGEYMVLFMHVHVGRFGQTNQLTAGANEKP